MLLPITLHAQAVEQKIEPEDFFVPRSIVIVKSTTDFNEAMRVAEAASKKLDIHLSDTEVFYDPKIGLTFPRDVCVQEFGEFPCYVARGRHDDSAYVSVEHSSAYSGFREGLYIVVVATGPVSDETVVRTLAMAKKFYPDAYAKTTSVYIGCMH